MIQQERNSYQPVNVEVTSIDGRPTQAAAGTGHEGMVKSLMHMFGLDPRAAALVTLVDLMMLTLDIASAGTFIIIGIAIAAYVAYLVYRMQRKFLGDDHETSLIKAMVVGLLMAIPIPLTPILAIFFGVAGTMQLVRHPLDKKP